MDKLEKMRKTAKYISKSKTSRFAYRMRNYNAHSEIHYEKGISDPKPDFSKISQLQDHLYA